MLNVCTPLDSKARYAYCPFDHLDPLLQILLEVGTVHDAILNWVGAVDEQLDLVLLAEFLHGFALALQGLLSGLLGGFCCGGHAAFYSETCLKS